MKCLHKTLALLPSLTAVIYSRVSSVEIYSLTEHTAKQHWHLPLITHIHNHKLKKFIPILSQSLTPSSITHSKGGFFFTWETHLFAKHTLENYELSPLNCLKIQLAKTEKNPSSFK